jgi:type VI secretion system ImpC/EvpB family protein
VSAAGQGSDRRESEPEPLRAQLLSGRHSTRDVAGLGDDLAAFLDADAGAFARWFGPELAAAARVDPERLRGMVDRDLAVIDRLLAAQLDAILHHPSLQRLEGSWRGLAWMVERFEPGKQLKTAVLSATWRELERDLTRASEFDQSHFFRLVYENEFGHAGGEPFGLLVVDREVRHRPEQRRPGDPAPTDDIVVLAALANVAAAAFAPTIVAASPHLFEVDNFEDLVLSHDVTALLAGPDHARWRALTLREEARFLAATMPRILARPLWSAHLGSLWYSERAPSARERTWFVGGYAFAAAVGRAFAAHGWPADIRGVTSDRIGGGLVLDLPSEEFVFGERTRWERSSIDLALTDRQERDLVLAGVMPLNTLPQGDAAFASVHSLQTTPPDAPGRDPSPFQANRRLSAQISAMLCVSRFAHYVKIIGRELTGSLADADAVERRLGQWLAGYTNVSASPTANGRARYPLMSSSVRVRELPERPGAFGCVIHLQPYFQLDDLSTTFRLITGLGSTRAAA